MSCFCKKTHEIENFMCRNDQEGNQNHKLHQNSSLAYLPPKVAIAVLRFPPRISHISIRGYAQKCLRTHRWPLGLVFDSTVRWYGQILMEKLIKNILSLKLLLSKRFFVLWNVKNWLKIFWKCYEGSLIMNGYCKDDIVERNVVANLPGIYWRKMDRHAAYISYFKLQY